MAEGLDKYGQLWNATAGKLTIENKDANYQAAFIRKVKEEIA